MPDPQPALIDRVAERLALQSPGCVVRNVLLSELSAWRVGGPADIVFSPRSERDLISGIALLQDSGITVTIVGMTTNLLFADEGLRGALVVIGNGLSNVEICDATMSVGAGSWVPYVALAAMRAGLSGIEHICGIPGTIGGLLCMNGGSLRRSIGENVRFVRVWSGDGGPRVLSAQECDFSYRGSRFQSGQDLILSAQIELAPGNRSEIRSEMLGILAARRRFPRKIPNCGSVFVSEPTTFREWGSPGAMIERAGLKGTRVGGAQIAPEHANFILNTGGATAGDILELMNLARYKVWQLTGTWMRTEAHYVTEAGSISPATDVDTQGLAQ